MRVLTLTTLLAMALLVAGCGDDRTAEVDGGGVVLSVSDFDGLPIVVSVTNALNTTGLVTIDEITIENISKTPNAPTSDLQNVEMQNYEVTFSRADTGTRLPPPMVRNIFGVTPVNGDQVYENLPILTTEQLSNEPLSDLAVFGFDNETAEQKIVLNINLRFFGRTISGEAVDTAPISFTVDFVP